MININMRCIEIEMNSKLDSILEGLTLTWDVLKCKQTYDSFAMPFKININMRCIEM